MAKARRNIKTHPKPRDVADDPFVPPDRQDQFLDADTGGTEVVNIFGSDETVDTGVTSGDDAPVDLNSAAEGDARGMASEGGSDDGTGDDRRAAGDVDARRGGDRTTRARGSGAGDDPDEGYSAKVRKRIARERALVNRERALREQTQGQLAEERAARQAQDERIAKLERAQTEIAGNAGVKDIEAQIAALRPQITAALEGGDTAKTLELNEKLSDLKAKLEVLKYDLGQRQRAAEAAAASKRTTGTTAATTDTTSETDPRVAELAVQFQKMNRHWWNRSANKAAREDAITIDREILGDIQAGELDFEPYSDEHWEELAHRLHETYPELEIQDLDGQPYIFDNEEDMTDTAGRRTGGNNARPQNGGRQQQPGRGARVSAPVARMGQNGRRGPDLVEKARRGQVEIDDDLRNTMRIFKVDPNDPNAKKYFARERARTILSGQDEKYGGGNR
jgi:hypothetical protein